MLVILPRPSCMQVETRLRRPTSHVPYGIGRKGIILYLEYRSVYPFRLNWLPRPPLQQASVSPPLEPKGGATLACGEGAGGANSDDSRESLTLLSTRWYRQSFDLQQQINPWVPLIEKSRSLTVIK